MTSAQIWGFGFLACLGISLIGFIAAGILLIIKRIGNDSCFQYVVKFMFALAAGALLGDVVVHILPEAYGSETTQSSFVALTFICSVAFFLILERIFQKCGITHEHWNAEEEKPAQIGDGEVANQQNGSAL